MTRQSHGIPGTLRVANHRVFAVPGEELVDRPSRGSWLPAELTFVGSCCLRGAFGAVADAAQHAVFQDEVQRLDEVPQPGLGGTVGKTLSHEQAGVSAAVERLEYHCHVDATYPCSGMSSTISGTSGCAGVPAPINTRWCGGSTSMTCQHTCLSRPERRSRTCRRSQCLHRPPQAAGRRRDRSNGGRSSVTNGLT
jgi:hypothetical protein